MNQKQYSLEEISQHNSSSSVWVIMHKKVYDLTTFLSSHPGGDKIILKFAGKDATDKFDMFHSNEILEKHAQQFCIGSVTPLSQQQKNSSSDNVPLSPKESQTSGNQALVPLHIDEMLNVFDFEHTAKHVMKKEGWAYYSSGADDEICMRMNQLAFQRYLIKPRVLVNVASVDTTATFFTGHKLSMPLYVTATALGKLADPHGEIAIRRACEAENIPQMIPTLASYSLEQILEGSEKKIPFMYQIYVHSDRKIVLDMLRRIENAGCCALVITVDAPELGRREKDMRMKFVDQPPDIQKSEKLNTNEGTARAIGRFIDPSLSWEDLAWFRANTKLPIFLKGIQCSEDAILAYQHNVQGIIVSNHGGRQLDSCPASIDALAEIVKGLTDFFQVSLATLKERQTLSSLQSAQFPETANGTDHSSSPNLKMFKIFLDGGIRRGTDIFKALALGADMVGMGRPALYGLASFGQQGVERVVQLLRKELVVAMKLSGAKNLSDIAASKLLVPAVPPEVASHVLWRNVYEPLQPVSLDGRVVSKL